MGMLEMAGALGGVGRGIEKNVDFERQKDMQALEEAREMRVRQFEAEQAAKRQTAEFGHEDKSQGAAFGHEEKMQGGAFGQQEKLQKGTQAFESGEHAKDRASREKIAGISAAARTAAANRTALGKRWESKVVKKTTMDAKGVPTDTEQLSVFDKNSARTFEQEGNKFFPQGTPHTRKIAGADGKPAEQPIRDAAQSEVQKLLQNPDQADNFLRTYGYLPYEFFNGAGAATTPEPDTSSEDDGSAE